MSQILPQDRVFNYIPSWDARNEDYPIRTLLAAEPVKPNKFHYWGHGEVLDQGYEGACVGFGWAAELMASPQRVRFLNPDAYARDIYRTAQKVDEWAGENYEGTSVLAGAKVVKDRGLISEYRWAFNVEDIIHTVVELGPVVVGIPWYESMYYTRPSGLVEVGGNLVGGHCLTITGYSPGRRFYREGFAKREVFRWINSWGKSYGKRGSGYIHVDDFAQLFSEYGEACIPLRRVDPGTKI